MWGHCARGKGCTRSFQRINRTKWAVWVPAWVKAAWGKQILPTKFTARVLPTMLWKPPAHRDPHPCPDRGDKSMCSQGPPSLTEAGDTPVYRGTPAHMVSPIPHRWPSRALRGPLIPSPVTPSALAPLTSDTPEPPGVPWCPHRWHSRPLNPLTGDTPVPSGPPGSPGRAPSAAPGFQFGGSRDRLNGSRRRPNLREGEGASPPHKAPRSPALPPPPRPEPHPGTRSEGGRGRARSLWPRSRGRLSPARTLLRGGGGGPGARRWRWAPVAAGVLGRERRGKAAGGSRAGEGRAGSRVRGDTKWRPPRLGLRRHDGLGEGRPRCSRRLDPRIQKFLFPSSGLGERRRVPKTEPWWFCGSEEKCCGYTGVSHGSCGAKLPSERSELVSVPCSVVVSLLFFALFLCVWSQAFFAFS